VVAVVVVDVVVDVVDVLYSLVLVHGLDDKKMVMAMAMAMVTVMVAAVSLSKKKVVSFFAYHCLPIKLHTVLLENYVRRFCTSLEARPLFIYYWCSFFSSLFPLNEENLMPIDRTAFYVQ
jgi:hypothetical protein